MFSPAFPSGPRKRQPLYTYISPAQSFRDALLRDFVQGVGFGREVARMTLVSAPYWPVALVLAHLAGQGEWPLGAIKVSGMITLCAARGVTGGLLRSVQLSSHEVLFRVDRLRLFCSQVSRVCFARLVKGTCSRWLNRPGNDRRPSFTNENTNEKFVEPEQDPADSSGSGRAPSHDWRGPGQE